LRVGAEDEKGKAQKWCRCVWIEVEMWEIAIEFAESRPEVAVRLIDAVLNPA
jgi:hypothetical protein